MKKFFLLLLSSAYLVAMHDIENQSLLLEKQVPYVIKLAPLSSALDNLLTHTSGVDLCNALLEKRSEELELFIEQAYCSTMRELQSILLEYNTHNMYINSQQRSVVINVDNPLELNPEESCQGDVKYRLINFYGSFESDFKKSMQLLLQSKTLDNNLHLSSHDKLIFIQNNNTPPYENTDEFIKKIVLIKLLALLNPGYVGFGFNSADYRFTADSRFPPNMSEEDIARVYTFMSLLPVFQNNDLQFALVDDQRGIVSVHNRMCFKDFKNCCCTMSGMSVMIAIVAGYICLIIFMPSFSW